MPYIHNHECINIEESGLVKGYRCSQYLEGMGQLVRYPAARGTLVGYKIIKDLYGKVCDNWYETIFVLRHIHNC